MTAAAQASGDPAFRSLRSKPAIIGFLSGGDFALGGAEGAGSISLTGLHQDDATSAARFLNYHPGSGGLVFSDIPTDEVDDGGGGGGDENTARDQWNAQLLEGAASIAIANGDTAIPAAGSTGLAISFLVDGDIGGAMVAGMSSEEQNGAASYLDYVNGTLRYSE